MLSFATEFPINPISKTPNFIEAVKIWLVASPHTEFSDEDLNTPPADGSWTVIKKNERLDALLLSSASEEAAAIKHTKIDGDISWETTIIFSRKDSDAWVGVRTSRESKHPATRLPPAKKPIVVRTLLDKLGGANDGKLLVTSAVQHRDLASRACNPHLKWIAHARARRLNEENRISLLRPLVALLAFTNANRL